MTVENLPLVHVVLGVHRPNPSLLERQLRSVHEQTHRNFRLLLTFDGPAEPEISALASSFDDERFAVIEFDRNVGVHANYARGLERALSDSEDADDLFAFCDQDDVWHEDKLARQVELMVSNARCGLCHCDARVVDEDGRVISSSLFARERRSERMGLLDLLVMNSVTGMTCVFTEPVARSAAGFPMASTPEMLHDHWLALVAAARTEVVFMDRALVDYVQHRGNELGARDRIATRATIRNLLFGGREYWLRCKRQYEWRAQAFEALIAAFGPEKALRDSDVRGWGGSVVLLGHCLGNWTSGNVPQAAQSWRMLAGKALGA